jgi:hypothetical protein
MLLFHPRLVRFGPATWDNTTAIAIDRAAHRTIEEWTDAGAYASLADVPEQKVRIRITQEISRDDIDAPRPGEQADLIFYTAPTLTDASRRKVSTTAVILAVEHNLSPKSALRTITLAAISPDGVTDPITITDASHGQL